MLDYFDIANVPKNYLTANRMYEKCSPRSFQVCNGPLIAKYCNIDCLLMKNNYICNQQLLQTNKDIKIMTKTLLAMVLAAFAFVACTNVKQAEESSEQKILVLYYSQTGTTAKVAEEIKNQLGADIQRIEVDKPYDGDFQATIERCQKEKDSVDVLTIKSFDYDLSDYDVIFLGYPIWFGSYALPIERMLLDPINIQVEGKTIVPFCTFGSGGLVESTEKLRKELDAAKVIDGYGVRSARMDAMPEEVNRFLIENGFKEGDIEALPAFMEQHPVTDEEKAVFDEACSDYEYPLGTPVTVAVRETSGSTDYQFTAKTTGQDGQESTATVYVTVSKKEGAKAEFTRVDRI